MITPKLIMTAEDNLMCHCANRVKTAFGCMFYNDGNVDSHDCNHALLYSHTDLPVSLAQIEGFYAQKCRTPRIFSAGVEGETTLLIPYLKENGWTVETYDEREIYLYNGYSGGAPKTALEMKKAETMEDDLYAAFMENDDGGEWCAKAAADSMKYGKINIYAGYENGVCASSVSVEHDPGTGLALVQDVFTLKPFRGKGYARDLTRFALAREADSDPGYNIYLWVENPIAKNVYRDVGFVPADFTIPCWSAYKSIH